MAVLCMILAGVPLEAHAAKAKISPQKLTLYAGETKTLRLSGTVEKAQWRSLKRSVTVVTVNGKVTAKKAGKTVIEVKAGKKTLKCQVTVRKADAAHRLLMANREAKRVVKKYISSDMNVAERAYVLGRWLTENCSWQKDQTDAAYRKNYGNEAYAALVLRKAACSGYAKAYMILCRIAKVPVKHINAGQKMHQWNEVEIRGKWIKVDTYNGTFENTKGIRKSLLRRETYNEEGKKETPLFSFTIEM